MTESQSNKFAAPFTEMAERISRNPEAEFSGALVFVPPTGEVIAVQVNDPKRDLAAFLALSLGKLQNVANELQQQAAPQFGHQRR